MSHTVKITRTTTTVSPSGVFLNTGYFKSIPGILKLLETILGAVCVGLMATNVTDCRYFNILSRELFFLMVSTTFMIATFIILLSGLLCIYTATILPKTFFEVFYHSVAFALYVSASITVLVTVNQYKYDKYRYNEILAAGIIGLVNSVLYLISAIFGYRSYKVL